MSNRERVDFKADRFLDLVDQKGYNLVHYRSLPCPCINSQSNSPDPNCPFCENGYQYYDEETIKGVISSVTMESQFTETGAFWLGAMLVTYKPDVKIGYHDRLVHMDSEIPFSESLIKGSWDKARFLPVSVNLVTAIVSGSQAFYTNGVDFTVSGRDIVWAADHGPADGSRYTIAYDCHPTWLVLSHQHLLRDTLVKFRNPADVYTPLPRQVLCKLEYLVE